MGQLPDKLRGVQRASWQYRHALESAVMSAKNEISVTDAHWIDSASQHQQHAGIVRWVLRTRLEQMSAHEITSASRAISQACDARNRCLERLGLDVRPDDLAALYRD